MSLRVRLTVVATLVALAGIAAVDVATTRTLTSRLDQRLDQQLVDLLDGPPPQPPQTRSRQAANTTTPATGAGRDVTSTVDPGGGTPPAPGGEPGSPNVPGDQPAAPTAGHAGSPPPRLRSLPATTWFGTVDEEGRVSDDQLPVEGNLVATKRETPRFHRGEPRELRHHPITARTVSGHTSLRVAARPIPGGRLLRVAAAPRTEIIATRDKLVRIELLVSGIAALLVALVAAIAISRALRPLRAIAGATGAVEGAGLASASLARVPGEDGPAEVAQLARSINGMLERLEHAFAEQQAGDQRLRRFVGDASHELRTPLTSIRGFAELVGSRGTTMVPEDLARALASIEGESVQMTRLVDDLLALSHFDEQVPLELAESSLGAIAGAAVDAARAVDQSAGASRTIELELPDGPRSARVDPARVRQVLDNLLANVRVHAPEAHRVVVTVAAAEHGEWTVISVADDGPGIDPGARDAAFDRFWRADRARTRATGGSGLGLSLVRAIAEAHGGTASMGDGLDGRGTTVRVELPRG